MVSHLAAVMTQPPNVGNSLNHLQTIIEKSPSESHIVREYKVLLRYSFNQILNGCATCCSTFIYLPQNRNHGQTKNRCIEFTKQIILVGVILRGSDSLCNSSNFRNTPRASLQFMQSKEKIGFWFSKRFCSQCVLEV